LDTNPATQPTDNAVDFQSVVKRFGNVTAVGELNFSIGKGEFFSLLGPSGCGKTTTLRLIAGFETPSEGKVVIHGQDVSQVPPHQRNVNTVFQSYALFPHLDVFENIAFGLRRKRCSESDIKTRVKESLELVSMSEFERRDVRQLSGGQQQRVALARALVNRPEVLLLDEPMAALDSKLKKKMQIELKSLQKLLGLTFVLVTHDQEEALLLSDRIAVLKDGKVQQVSPPRELYRHPSNQFVAEFIGSANFLPVDVREGTAYFQGAKLTNSRTESDGKFLWMLRPESLAVTDERTEEGPCLAGEIITSVFGGSTMIHTLELQDGTSLTCEQLNSRNLASFATGQKLFLSWRADTGQFIKADEKS
jgi:spermidine/putrescine transport system ATP-binding protein